MTEEQHSTIFRKGHAEWAAKDNGQRYAGLNVMMDECGCGNSPGLHYLGTAEDSDGPHCYRVKCPCGAMGPISTSWQEAIRMWNRH